MDKKIWRSPIHDLCHLIMQNLQLFNFFLWHLLAIHIEQSTCLYFEFLWYKIYRYKCFVFCRRWRWKSKHHWPLQPLCPRLIKKKCLLRGMIWRKRDKRWMRREDRWKKTGRTLKETRKNGWMRSTDYNKIWLFLPKWVNLIARWKC